MSFDIRICEQVCFCYIDNQCLHPLKENCNMQKTPLEEHIKVIDAEQTTE